MASRTFGPKPTNVENELGSFVCVAIFTNDTSNQNTVGSFSVHAAAVLSSQLERKVLNRLALFPSLLHLSIQHLSFHLRKLHLVCPLLSIKTPTCKGTRPRTLQADYVVSLTLGGG